VWKREQEKERKVQGGYEAVTLTQPYQAMSAKTPLTKRKILM
jgi:hypothetical protein